MACLSRLTKMATLSTSTGSTLAARTDVCGSAEKSEGVAATPRVATGNCPAVVPITSLRVPENHWIGAPSLVAMMYPSASSSSTVVAPSTQESIRKFWKSPDCEAHMVCGSFVVRAVKRRCWKKVQALGHPVVSDHEPRRHVSVGAV